MFSSIAFDGVCVRSRRPNGEVRRGPLAFGDQRVGGLLNPVMQEPVGLLFPQHQPGPHRSPKHRVHRFFAFAPDHGQGADRRAIAETGQHVQGKSVSRWAGAAACPA